MGKDSQRIREFMFAHMRDSAHDAQRVLRTARAEAARHFCDCLLRELSPQEATP